MTLRLEELAEIARVHRGAIEALFARILDALGEGREVHIKNFGTFRIGSIDHHPNVPAGTKVMRFKAARSAKEKLNHKESPENHRRITGESP